ncbi:hypothetical protein Cflav_PD1072 [Pedosphaera parvula Ellin514]|uniref:Uncharacterized protein n=1 Tax=Pedosphaera parvula (strain Ellin514) TaxID=320771 RepID=B9XNY3_PEDPL|nr:hypothetical protein Cflav_PD1072 [Pedosphaera parvula Ellin514]
MRSLPLLTSKLKGFVWDLAKLAVSQGKVVRLAGLEPAIRGFSSLLIIAILCADLLILIRQEANKSNGYVVSNGNDEQIMLCGIVREERLCGGHNLCG